MTLETFWLEEKWEGLGSSFFATVMLYGVPQNMTGTGEDNTEIDSRLLVSLCCENNVVPHLCPTNYDKLRQKVSPFA
jgi:hypothetical protein